MNSIIQMYSNNIALFRWQSIQKTPVYLSKLCIMYHVEHVVKYMLRCE